MARRALSEREAPPDENRILILLIGFSLLGHIGVYALSGLNWLAPTEELTAEWSIEVDMDDGTNVLGASSIPKSVKSKELKVAKKILPQLPKSYTIERDKKEEDGLAVDDKARDKTIGEDKLHRDSLVDKEDNKAAKKLKMKEALKRLALEELRKKKSFAKKTKAPLDDPMARIAEEAKKARKTVKKSSDIGHYSKYGMRLKRQILRHYKLPQTFASPISELRVVLTVVVNRRGKLVSVRIKESSQDPVFDEYTVQAAKNASPYDFPPKSLAGRKISLIFTR